MHLQHYLKEKKELVDKFLTDYLTEKRKDSNCPQVLREAMEYALMAGGKRIRPILCIAGYEAVKGKEDTILPVAASLELIHTYSLIHDDLPAMDDDDLRRNKPTTHKVFGEATAILAGDALLTDAFNMISRSPARPKTLVRVIQELSYASGPEGMVGGQSVDILLEGKQAGEKELVYIHTHKTGSLIQASISIGALMGNASPARLKALTEYGKKIGLAFQVVDDILDIIGSKEEMGKSTGADGAKGKNTYPSIFGLEKSQNIADTLVSEARMSLKRFNHSAEPLLEIARYITARRN